MSTRRGHFPPAVSVPDENKPYALIAQIANLFDPYGIYDINICKKGTRADTTSFKNCLVRFTFFKDNVKYAAFERVKFPGCIEIFPDAKMEYV